MRGEVTSGRPEFPDCVNSKQKLRFCLSFFEIWIPQQAILANRLDFTLLPVIIGIRILQINWPQKTAHGDVH